MKKWDGQRRMSARSTAHKARRAGWNGQPMAYGRMTAATASRSMLPHVFRIYRRQREDLEGVALRQWEMLANVSHDLRSPLASIMLNASALLEVPSRDDQVTRQCAKQIQCAVQRMNRLIHDLLDFESIRTGHLCLDAGVHGAAPIVDELVKCFLPIAEQRQVTLMAEHGMRLLPEVRCDRSRIIQVLDNLISNAVKVTPAGGTVCVRVEAVGRDLRFAVADNGPGIADEDQPRLFNWLWRARTSSYQGTGRGLAIAKGIVEAHGGRIWVESKLGVGTTFYFTLPAVATCS
jgi:signal transduction histidine kinase